MKCRDLVVLASRVTRAQRTGRQVQSSLSEGRSHERTLHSHAKVRAASTYHGSGACLDTILPRTLRTLVATNPSSSLHRVFGGRHGLFSQLWNKCRRVTGNVSAAGAAGAARSCARTERPAGSTAQECVLPVAAGRFAGTLRSLPRILECRDPGAASQRAPSCPPRRDRALPRATCVCSRRNALEFSGSPRSTRRSQCSSHANSAATRDTAA
jgi:hypothetical protein